MITSDKKVIRSIAHVLDLIGEGWSMLILREVYLGTQRFENFQKQLGIARNILTTCLKKVCQNEILDFVPIKPCANRHEYLLTNKGNEPMPLLMALMEWGKKMEFGENSESVTFLDRENWERIDQIKVISARVLKLKSRDIVVLRPGASAVAMYRINKLKVVTKG
jgi:DNA-binding HxlR family transcriptional regulator